MDYVSITQDIALKHRAFAKVNDKEIDKNKIFTDYIQLNARNHILTSLVLSPNSICLNTQLAVNVVC